MMLAPTEKMIENCVEVDTKRHAFVDLDGVLARFEEGFYDAFRCSWPATTYRDRWQLVSAHPDFFGSLKRGCPDLIYGLQTFFAPKNVHILTSCPEDGFERYARQKKLWVQKNVPELQGLILFSRGGTRKSVFVQNNGDLLVDDTAANLQAWYSCGGHTLYVDVENYTTFAHHIRDVKL